MGANPYQPPGCRNEFPTMNANMMRETKIGVDYGVADLTDGIISVVACTIFIFLPAVVVGIVSHSILLGLLTFFSIYGSILSVMIWSVRVSEAGIRFVRLLGYPRFLSWDQMEKIEPVDRTEVILRGWLEPRFPPREITYSSSTRNHFIVAWSGNWLYFPPRNVRLFREFIRRYHDKSPLSAENATHTVDAPAARVDQEEKHGKSKIGAPCP